MNMRERMARTIAREGWGAESIWKKRLRLVDKLLADLTEPTEAVVAAARATEIREQ